MRVAHNAIVPTQHDLGTARRALVLREAVGHGLLYASFIVVLLVWLPPRSGAPPRAFNSRPPIRRWWVNLHFLFCHQIHDNRTCRN